VGVGQRCRPAPAGLLLNWIGPPQYGTGLIEKEFQFKNFDAMKFTTRML